MTSPKIETPPAATPEPTATQPTHATPQEIENFLSCPTCRSKVKEKLQSEVLKDYRANLKDKKTCRCTGCGLELDQNTTKCPACGGTKACFN